MNEILKLSGSFFSRKSPSKPGAATLPATAFVTSSHLIGLAEQLEHIRDEWQSDCITEKMLVSVYYERIVPKSSRTQRILSENSSSADFTVVGSKFGKGPSDRTRHIVTHCIGVDALNRSIEDLNLAARIVEREFEKKVTREKLNPVNDSGTCESYDELLKRYGSNRSRFSQTVVDVCLIERFGIERAVHPEIRGEAIVTLYSTGTELVDLLDELGINYKSGMILDETTVVLPESEYLLLAEKAPYLIAMSAACTDDWTTRMPDDSEEDLFSEPSIPAPASEPTIGVIDTLFNNKVYFSDWVEFHDMLDKNIDHTAHSYIHGTKVASVIVDGPTLNPALDDGCGRFKVRHFGITNGEKLHLLTVLRLVPQIVRSNRDIKVWNLSLGSPLPISTNSISPVAAMLDQLQRSYNVIFVVAGTNDRVPVPGEIRPIGSPADSINSLVVNSIKKDGEPASYSRRGPALSFFGKPDVCYFGGDIDEPLTAYAPWGNDDAEGTSFAAPWLARKLAYLIEMMGLTREAAKALIIDAAAGWEKEDLPLVKGYGMVPTHINDILSTKDDEIKFILTGKSTMYDTYTYRIPVPINKGKHPYYAKATLCYFPECSRNQGVDYTNTELDLRIGRLNNGSIKPIDDNMQGEPGVYINEETARKYFRKWDNVKLVAEEIKPRRYPRKAYESAYWGISLKAKERFRRSQTRSEIDFAIVVTLKEMFGVNRIDEFIRHCELAQWRVTKLDVATKLDVFATADEEVAFDG